VPVPAAAAGTRVWVWSARDWSVHGARWPPQRTSGRGPHRTPPRSPSRHVSRGSSRATTARAPPPAPRPDLRPGRPAAPLSHLHL